MTAFIPSRLFALLLAGAFATLPPAPVHAQPSATGEAATTAIRNSLAAIIGFATFGSVDAGSLDIQLSPDGDGYRVRVPFAAADPAASAVTGTAKPARDGSWNIGQLAFPSTVTLHPQQGEAVYAIGSQSVTVHVDPTLAHPSTWAGTFDDVSVSGITGPLRGSQHIGHYATSGSLSSATAGLLNLNTEAKGQDWDLRSSGGPGGALKGSVRDVHVDMAVAGLDPIKAGKLRQHLQRAGLLGSASQAGADAPPETADALLADASGLLRRLEGKETLRGLTFTTTPTADGIPVTGTIGELTVGTALNAGDTDLDARLDLAMDQMTLSVVPPAYAAFMPRNITLHHILRGIPGARIMALLRSALSGSDPDALRMQATGLLASPEAQLGIDPFSFDAGPLRARGSARLTSGADGSVIGRVHLVATGMDALLNEIARNPDMAQMTAGLFLAKGMAKSEGQTLVWDIDFGKGPPLVNGVPVGAPPAPR